MTELKQQVIRIIERLTENTRSIFYEKLSNEAGEFGIGEAHVQQVVNELKAEEILCEPCQGVLRKI